MTKTLPGDKTVRPSIVFHEDLLAEFDSVCDSEGVSRSGKLRELAEEYIADHAETNTDTGLTPPGDPQLADAYRTLRDLTDQRRDEYDRITRETAENNLYTQDTPKDAVFSALILPLQDRGYVKVQAAMEKVWIYVR